MVTTFTFVVLLGHRQGAGRKYLFGDDLGGNDILPKWLTDGYE